MIKSSCHILSISTIDQLILVVDYKSLPLISIWGTKYSIITNCKYSDVMDNITLLFIKHLITISLPYVMKNRYFSVLNTLYQYLFYVYFNVLRKTKKHCGGQSFNERKTSHIQMLCPEDLQRAWGQGTWSQDQPACFPSQGIWAPPSYLPPCFAQLTPALPSL